MVKQLTLRPIQKQDYPTLERVICETWDFDQYGKRTADLLSRSYLAGCLCDQTFTCVAELDGAVVGIIMGNNKRTHKTLLPAFFRLFAAQSLLFLSKEGFQPAHFFNSINHIDKKLLAKAGCSYEGELSLFAVDPASRSLGVGRQLYAALLDYFHRENIQHFYLYTDSDCNFDFYERRGLQRRCTYQRSFGTGPEGFTMTFYLYDNLGFSPDQDSTE